MQGLFIHVSNGTYPVSGSLGFTNSVRINNLSPVYHKELPADTLQFLRLAASYSGKNPGDPAVIYFANKATKKFDKDLDALKLMNTDPAVPNFFSISSDEAKLSIYSVPYPGDSTKVVPLGLVTDKESWVDIKLKDTVNISPGLFISFKDANTGIIQDIKTISGLQGLSCAR